MNKKHKILIPPIIGLIVGLAILGYGLYLLNDTASLSGLFIATFYAQLFIIPAGIVITIIAAILLILRLKKSQAL